MREVHLREGEKVIIELTPHWVVFFWHIVLTVLTVGIWLPVLLIVIWVRRSTHYVLTNYRVLVESGIFSKTSKSSQLDKINDVGHYQSLWGRMFGYGNLTLETAGEMGSTVFANIPDPIGYQKFILDQVALFRREAARPVEDHSGDKKCPMCAEWVKAEAKVCRFCRHEFE